jgi:hypothetical protein
MKAALVRPGPDLDGVVGACGADELADRPAGAVFDPLAGGEHDRAVGLGSTGACGGGSGGLQVAFGHAERLLDLE